MDSLFSQSDLTIKAQPLAQRLRPQKLTDVIGQEHLVGKDGFLTKLVAQKKLPSLIFWGPPGVGKTTIAQLLAQQIESTYVSLSAVASGIKDVKEAVEKAQGQLQMTGKKTLLFIDEIHRFNKAQQDALLPSVEKGTITLVGATTENPSFEVISALLSRCRVLILNPLSEDNLRQMIENTLEKNELWPNGAPEIKEDAKQFLVEASSGDARRMLNTLETASLLSSQMITIEHIEQALQHKALRYDKNGEEHYNIISAFIKSMRSSDPDAALYYMARLLEAGEDPLFIIRRMVIFASEDIGNANPQALNISVSCKQALEFIGLPEGWIPMAQCATYLASSPKSNASYLAYKAALQDVKKHGPLEVPLHLRNAPTRLMKNLGYGKDYDYAHNQADHLTSQKNLPEKIQNQPYYYQPQGMGFEVRLMDWLEKARLKRES